MDILHSKAFKLTSFIILTVAVIALVLLNLAGLRFPEWVLMLTTILLALDTIFIVFSSDSTPVMRVILSIIAGLIALGALFFSTSFPYWNSYNFIEHKSTAPASEKISLNKAKADLGFVMSRLKKIHPAFIAGVPPYMQEAYDKALKNLEQADEITTISLQREIADFLSDMGDAHTNIYHDYGKETMFLREYLPKIREGYTLKAVNGEAISEIYEKNIDFYSYEAESWAVRQINKDLETKVGLMYLGYNPDNVTYTWMDKDGNTEDITYGTDDFLNFKAYENYKKQYAPKKEDGYLAYITIDLKKDLATFVLTSCVLNDDYRNAVRSMFSDVKKYGINNVAIDLRGNSGGNPDVVNEFIRYLDVDMYNTGTYYTRYGKSEVTTSGLTQNNKVRELIFDGNVYILTDSKTFSAAMMFAEVIKDNHLGKIIGEPPGNDPNGYSDIVTLRLPYSGLYMSLSTSRFERVNNTLTDRLIMPDYECEGDKADEKLFEIIRKNENR